MIGVWEHWMIFPKYYTDQLTEIFLKKENGEAQSVAGSSSPASDAVTMEDLDGEAYTDGEPMYEDQDVDGEPIEDDDVDGEPMEEEEEDVDGEPLQDDSQDQQFEHSIRDQHETEALYTEVEDMFS